VIFRNYTIGDISVGKLNFGVASDSSFNVSFDWRFKRCGQGLRFWAVLLDLSTRGMSRKRIRIVGISRWRNSS
jgi:hypothetical protein